MAKKQTRRSISVNRSVYELVQKVSEETGRSLSQLAEDGLLASVDVVRSVDADEITAIRVALRRPAAKKAA